MYGPQCEIMWIFGYSRGPGWSFNVITLYQYCFPFIFSPISIYISNMEAVRWGFFKLTRRRPQPCRYAQWLNHIVWPLPPLPPPRSTFVNVINYRQLSLHIDVTCILNMYSLIIGSPRISYGNMLCFKVFLNIYAELFWGVHTKWLTKSLCTPLHDDNRPILCPKGPL